MLNEWGLWLRAAGRPETTIALRQYHVRRVLSELPDPMTITTEELVHWLGSKTWAPHTRRAYRASLRGFYTWAQATGRRLDNPALGIPVVKVPRGLPRPTPEQVYLEALLAATPRVRVMVQLAAQCGLRRGEIARVRREDVVDDGDGHSLHVIGKGGHERLVPLPADLAQILLEQPPGWIFPSSSTRGGRAGVHLTPSHVGVLVSGVLPAGWTCHTLRHRCATIAYAGTHDLRAVQELLGHAKPETTALYTQVASSAIRRAVAAAASDPAA